MLNIKQGSKTIIHKKIHGNISILVILILLSSSVISLLAINQIQHLMTYWWMTFNYFRSYYLSKAWVELALSEVYSHWDGFDDKISTDDFVENFTTSYHWELDENNSISSSFDWFKPRFETTINWNFKYLVNDIRKDNYDWNEIILWPWAWMIIPLFSDISEERIPTTLKFKRFSSFEDLSINSNDNINDLMLWFFSFNEDWDMENVHVIKKWTNDLHTFLKNIKLWYFSYLTIKNSWKDEVKLYIDADWNLIPSSNFLITSRWYYGDMEVWLQSVVNKQIPSWSMNVLWAE